MTPRGKEAGRRPRKRPEGGKGKKGEGEKTGWETGRNVLGDGLLGTWGDWLLGSHLPILLLPPLSALPSLSALPELPDQCQLGIPVIENLPSPPLMHKLT